LIFTSKKWVKIDRQTVEKSARLWYYATNQKARIVVMLSIVLGAGLFGLAILFQRRIRA
jgi:hypothetical protein